MAKKKKKSAKSKSSAKSKRSTTLPKIGILHSGSAGPINDPLITAFIDGLGDGGYNAGDFTLDPPLWSNDDPNLLAQNADTLARNGFNLIIAAGGPASVYAIQEAQNATGTNTNVVFTSFSQLTRPAPNMTGVAARTSELDPSRLAQLHKLVQKNPKWADQKTFGVLENPLRNDYDPTILDDVADELNIQLKRVSVTPGPDKDAMKKLITKAFQDWKKAGIKVALVAADPLFNDLRSDVIKAETENNFAAMHQWKEFRNEGGYASYGTDLIEAYRKAGQIAADVLDDTPPLEIEVQPLTNIALSINPATAKRLGL
jgi:ABC-type uncharacterized transport system substrate-binding protein